MIRLLPLLLLAAPALAAPRTIDLPAETTQFLPGPQRDVAQGNCIACHSTDYIATQPRGLPNPRAFWQAEVTKMRAAYGAPIAEADMPAIVDYLTEAYGK